MQRRPFHRPLRVGSRCGRRHIHCLRQQLTELDLSRPQSGMPWRSFRWLKLIRYLVSREELRIPQIQSYRAS